MKHRETVLSLIAVALLFAAVAASAQTYTPLLHLSQSALAQQRHRMRRSVLSQGQDGELYSTIQTNGTHNSTARVYKMTTSRGL